MEVHVDVGHLLALQVQEALEDQRIGQWVDVGHTETVEGEAGGGAASDGEEDVPFPHELGDVPYDEEVVGILRLPDDLQLVGQSLPFRGSDVLDAAAQSLLAELLQKLLSRRPLRRLKLRES